MNTVPDPVFILIAEYVQIQSIPLLRDTCGDFRRVLDSPNRVWDSIIDQYTRLKKTGIILYRGSIGTTALMVKSSKIELVCTSCGSLSNLKMNKFYDLIVCSRCEHIGLFKTVNLREACTEFFLDYKQQQGNNSLCKIKYGRSFRILRKDVLRVANEEYPMGELQNKIQDRINRLWATRQRRFSARNKRINDMVQFFDRNARKNRARIDPIVQNMDMAIAMTNMYGCHSLVFGDVYNFKINTQTSSEEVSSRLCDYVMMITYMRKSGFLFDDYKCNFCSSGTSPFYIFKKHLNGGLHFYEATREYVDSVEELRKRAKEVERYVELVDTPMQRKTLAIAICVEDSIDYVEEDFEDFVTMGIGNPVYITRNKREKVFLNRNNYMVYVNHMLNQGYTISDAEKYSTNRILHETNGYPPMKRVCYINLPTNRMSRD